jgi:subtilase family serine protease
VTTTFWYVASGFLGEWLAEVSADPNPPLVHSISYGEPETLILQNSIDRMNSEFQQLGARGLSIISTSGDIGVSDGFVRGCDSDTPDYPSASPYTTSLGASAIARDYVSPICSGQSVDNSPLFCPFNMEIPCSADTGQGFTTGGGFSYKSKQPWYQQQVVDEYLQTAPLPPSSWFSSDGRAYNDVTALGSEILIIYGGQFVVTGGTSASGPIFAGVLALLNDIRLQEGKPSLGFVNPFLYSVAVDSRYVGAFNPITIGDNKCKELDANGNASCCKYGFDSAATTWDPLNGLGSPNFQVLKRAVEDLP